MIGIGSLDPETGKLAQDDPIGEDLDSFLDFYVCNLKPIKTSDNSPREINWIGKVHWFMTYGRLLFENLNTESEYRYFIAEPYDVIEDGGLRYSPTTMNIESTDKVKIKGIMDDNCSWNDGVDDTDYKGCVPWIRIDKLEIIK